MFSFTNKLYAITDVEISGLSHRSQIERLVAGGARLIQLREKDMAPRRFYAEAETALDFARSHGVQIIINDRVDIALALEADGVHLGQEDLPPHSARKLLGNDAVIGLSTHNLDQVRAASRLPVSYLGIGPIFPTSTKKNPQPLVGLDGLRRIREVARELPLVAIGGITLANAAAVLSAGADAVAIISALLDDPSQITTKAAEFLHAR